MILPATDFFFSFLLLMVGTVSTSFPLFDSRSGGQEELETAPVTHQYCAKFFSLDTPWVSSLLDSTNPVGPLPGGYCVGQRLSECRKRPTKSPSSEPRMSLLLSWCFLSSLLSCYSPHNSPVKPVFQIRKAIALGKQKQQTSASTQIESKGLQLTAYSHSSPQGLQGRALGTRMNIAAGTQTTERLCT